jgi:hypothetical protein
MQIFAAQTYLVKDDIFQNQIGTRLSQTAQTFAPSQNKVLKVGVFFGGEKLTAKKPSSPCKAPQNDHKNTTICTTFLQKPQQNCRFTSP